MGTILCTYECFTVDKPELPISPPPKKNAVYSLVCLCVLTVIFELNYLDIWLHG